MTGKRLLLGLIVVCGSLGLLTLWVGALAPQIASPEGEGVVQGRVVDMGTGEPLFGAWVGAGREGVATDTFGRYSLRLAPGIHSLRVEAPGYIGMTRSALRIEAQEVTPLDLEMIPHSPSPEQARAIDAKLMAPQQGLPVGLGSDDIDRGYRLSTVDEVPATLRVLMPDDSVVVMEMDEYLKGVVPSEVPAYWPTESLRAQAVAARSYASTRHSHSDQGADVCTTVHCQVWNHIHYDTTDRAVDDTHAVAATHQGSIIYAFFFAHCDGHTRNVEEVWGGYLPYCRSVNCPCGYDTMYGHGVGMCQHGARVLAEQGQSAADILQHFYSGVQVEPPDPGHIVSASMWPPDGDENTQFTFEVVYHDASGEPPAVANVLIDGHAHTLDRVPGGAGDRRYRLVTKLARGEHAYGFYLSDSYGHVARHPEEGSFSGPVVSVVDPHAPTPTPIEPLVSGVRSGNITLSTVDDWATGSGNGVRLITRGDGALELEAGRQEGIYASPVLTAPLPFVALAVTWHADVPLDGETAFEVRTTADGAIWGPWIGLDASEDDEERHNLFSTDLLFGQGVAVQFRVTLGAGEEGRSPVLENVRLSCLDTRGGPSATELAARRVAAAERPVVISRGAWGADESLMTWPPEYRDLRAIVLHHTATDTGGVDPAAMVRAIYYYHAVVREWGDIGYNYLVDHFGNVYEGRAGGPGVVGAHARRFNWGSIGIGLIGDHDTYDVPAAMQDALTEFLAWQCADHMIHPLEEGPFIDLTLPRIMAHKDCLDTICPGERAYALLPVIRSQTLIQMAQVPPSVQLASPGEGDVVRAVVDVTCETSAVVTRVDCLVDDVLRESDTTPPFSFRWNTAAETSAPHRLRIVAHNAAGSSDDEVQVAVDNTPPMGSASVAAWANSQWVRFDLESADATAVQFSNGWMWEGEDLYHEPGTGIVVSDALALNGLAWQGRAGQDVAGAWYGPYTCELPSWADYRAVYRIKAPLTLGEDELAILDIVDDQGRREYARRRIMGDTLARPGIYEELGLDFAYQGAWPTCDDPDTRDGLEFRTAFRAAGDLSLDRVTLFSEPQSFASPIYWPVLDREGTQTVTVRLLDGAGNAASQDVAVHLDTVPPQWLDHAARRVTVQDTLSGLDTTTAAYSISEDGGAVWWEWEMLVVDAEAGTTQPVELVAPGDRGTHVRFSILDVAGNVADSPVYSLGPTPTPTEAPTLPPATIAPTLPAITPTPRSGQWLPLVFSGA